METISRMSHVSLLSLMSEAGRTELLARASWRRVAAGQVLFREGDAGDEMFVVLSGLLQVVAEGLEGQQVVAVLGKGDYFGEMALISGERRHATVFASTEGTLLALSRELMEELFESEPSLREALGRIAVGRAEQLVETLAMAA